MIVAALQTRLPSTSDDIKEVLGYVDTGYTQRPTKSDIYIYIMDVKRVLYVRVFCRALSRAQIYEYVIFDVRSEQCREAVP